MTKPAALGKGLGALLGSTALASPHPVAEKGERVERVALNLITPSPFQPRKRFSPEQLEELVSSIRKQGIIQPLIVRAIGGGKFELIAGERRLRAAGVAGLETAPVIVRQASDREVLELALVENLQRADLGPLEEAEAYNLLITQFKLTQEEVAQRVGKSRAVVANSVRLLAMPEKVRGYIQTERLSVGHAKVILGLTNEQEQVLAAELVIKDGLTVRQTEKLVESLLAGGRRPIRRTKATANSGAFPDIAKRLQQVLGTRVRITGTANTGKIELQYFSAEDLNRLLKALGLPE
jgi:ParB family chromosome partitioning protein